jgi:hypothetical protein
LTCPWKRPKAVFEVSAVSAGTNIADAAENNSCKAASAYSAALNSTTHSVT